MSPLPGLGELAWIESRSRHLWDLWRMCSGLFIGTGSFFLGQVKFIPEPVPIVPLLSGIVAATHPR